MQVSVAETRANVRAKYLRPSLGLHVHVSSWPCRNRKRILLTDPSCPSAGAVDCIQRMMETMSSLKAVVFEDANSQSWWRFAALIKERNGPGSRCVEVLDAAAADGIKYETERPWAANSSEQVVLTMVYVTGMY